MPCRALPRIGLNHMLSSAKRCSLLVELLLKTSPAAAVAEQVPAPAVVTANDAERLSLQYFVLVLCVFCAGKLRIDLL